MAVKCIRCGRVYSGGSVPKFCGTCGMAMPEVATEAPARPTSDLFGASAHRMPQGIALGVDEKLVKSYRIGRYTLRNGSIDVLITNKRVIRYEESTLFGMKKNVIDEINIDAVQGTSCVMSRSLSIIGLIIGLALLIGSILAFSSTGGYASYYSSKFDTYYIIGGLVLLLLSALVFYSSLKPTLLFSLFGSVGGRALYTTVNMRGRIFGLNDRTMVFQFKPTAETTVMLKEIGACIYDLKTLGDRAISKWS